MRNNLRIALFVLCYAFLCSVPALAEEGWYLMIPPTGSAGKDKGQPSISAPLSKWETIKTFRAVMLCESEKTEIINILNDMINSKARDAGINDRPIGDPNEFKKRFVYANCISSNDPRLK